MNREIKFRAWNKDKKCFFKWDLSMGFTGTDKIWGDVQQFTGYKDKNDVDIYEGDICMQINMTVGAKFRYGCFFLCGKKDNGAIMTPEATDFHNAIKQYTDHGDEVDGKLIHLEVIGNIHENKDLLS